MRPDYRKSDVETVNMYAESFLVGLIIFKRTCRGVAAAIIRAQKKLLGCPLSKPFLNERLWPLALTLPIFLGDCFGRVGRTDPASNAWPF